MTRFGASSCRRSETDDYGIVDVVYMLVTLLGVLLIIMTRRRHPAPIFEVF